MRQRRRVPGWRRRQPKRSVETPDRRDDLARRGDTTSDQASVAALRHYGHALPAAVRDDRSDFGRSSRPDHGRCRSHEPTRPVTSAARRRLGVLEAMIGSHEVLQLIDEAAGDHPVILHMNPRPRVSPALGSAGACWVGQDGTNKVRSLSGSLPASSARQVRNVRVIQFHPISRVTPRGDQTRLASDVDAWLNSPPVRELAEVSGWEWPAIGLPLGLARALAALSDDWDFRMERNAERQERNFLAGGDAIVRGRTLDRDPVEAAARALGLVDSAPVTSHEVDNLVALSGLVKACVNRTRYAAALTHHGLEVGTVSVLAGHRHLNDPERDDMIELSYGTIDDEASGCRRGDKRGIPTSASSTQLTPRGPRIPRRLPSPVLVRSRTPFLAGARNLGSSVLRACHG